MGGLRDLGGGHRGAVGRPWGRGRDTTAGFNRGNGDGWKARIKGIGRIGNKRGNGRQTAENPLYVER